MCCNCSGTSITIVAASVELHLLAMGVIHWQLNGSCLEAYTGSYLEAYWKLLGSFLNNVRLDAGDTPARFEAIEPNTLLLLKNSSLHDDALRSEW
jgi:hypothetical protein